MSRRIIPTLLGKGWRFPGTGPPPTYGSLLVDLETVTLWECHLAGLCVTVSIHLDQDLG